MQVENPDLIAVRVNTSPSVMRNDLKLNEKVVRLK